MKTDILKFKAALLALALACSFRPEMLKAATPEIINIEQISENEFFEIIVLRIKTDAVESILDLLDFLTDKKVAQETLDSIINKHCKTRLAIINTAILSPLKIKLDLVKANNPKSPFCTILEKTHTLAQEMAYTELAKLVALLEEHKRDTKNAKKATALGGRLNPHFTKLKSPETLKKFNDKLTEIYSLAEQANASIVTKLNKEQIIEDIKKKVAALEKKANGAELLTLWSTVLKKG